MNLNERFGNLPSGFIGQELSFKYTVRAEKVRLRAIRVNVRQ